MIIKEIEWILSSKKDLLSFRPDVYKNIGRALNAVQQGNNPNDVSGIKAKSLRGFGVGAEVMELLEDYKTDTYRAVYTVKIGDKIYVLHCYQKKSKASIGIPKQDAALIESRLKTVKEMVRNEK